MDFFEIPPTEQPRDADEGDVRISEACNDSIGRMTVPDDEIMFDLPEQRMEEAPEAEESRSGKAAVRLHPPAFARVVQAFEKKIGTEFFYPAAEKRLTYGDAMVFQARQLRRVIEGEMVAYQPLLLK